MICIFSKLLFYRTWSTFRGYTKWKGVCYDFPFRLVIQAITLLFSSYFALNVLIVQLLRMNSQDSLFSSSYSVKTEAFSSPSLTEQKQKVSLLYSSFIIRACEEKKYIVKKVDTSEIFPPRYPHFQLWYFSFAQGPISYGFMLERKYM